MERSPPSKSVSGFQGRWIMDVSLFDALRPSKPRWTGATASRPVRRRRESDVKAARYEANHRPTEDKARQKKTLLERSSVGAAWIERLKLATTGYERSPTHGAHGMADTCSGQRSRARAWVLKGMAHGTSHDRGRPARVRTKDGSVSLMELCRRDKQAPLHISGC